MRFPQLCVPLKADKLLTRPLEDYFKRADLIEIAKSDVKLLVDAAGLIQFVDVDHSCAAQFCPIIKTLLPSAKIIVSFHDFEKTPSDLDSIVLSLQTVPADLYKIATLAHSSLDVFRLLKLLKTHESLIAIPMGPIGQFGRVLASVFGSKISFALMTAQDYNAPGQLAIDLLLDTYRFRSLNQQTALYGLIGDPIEQSVGEIFHNILMENQVYVKMAVKVEQLEPFLQQAKDFGFQGLSVTMPLKEAILPYLDKVDPQARRIGAVNTVHFKGGRLFGYNTDGVGALNALEQTGEQTGCLVMGKRILLLGAGGSARAIGFEAITRGAEVVIYNRTEARARQVAHSLGCRGGGSELLREPYDILINCTPDGLPIDPDLLLPGKWVMDIAVNPTRLLAIARSKQCRVVNGMQMYIQQAHLQRAIWF